MNTLYLRKEISEKTWAGYPINFVAYYRDEAATDLAATDYNSSKPTYRNKYVMLNCSKYKIVWLPELTPAKK